MQGDSIIMGFGYLIVLVILNYSLEIQGKAEIDEDLFINNFMKMRQFIT